MIALAVCSAVARPPFIGSLHRRAGWRKWEEHTSPSIPVLTSPDSVLAPCESPVLQVPWPFCDLSTYFPGISFSVLFFLSVLFFFFFFFFFFLSHTNDFYLVEEGLVKMCGWLFKYLSLHFQE